MKKMFTGITSYGSYSFRYPQNMSLNREDDNSDNALIMCRFEGSSLGIF